MFLPQPKVDLRNEFPVQPKANYYGWIGAERIDLFVQYGSGDMLDGYYNNKNGKRVSFSAGANTNDNTGLDFGPSGKPFELNMGLRDDSINELELGKIIITNQFIEGRKTDLNRGVKFLEAQTIIGTFQPKTGLNEDVYLTQNNSEVENWTSKPLKGKVYKADNSVRLTYFIDMGGDGGQFFTYESWWFNQFKDGDEIIIVGKIREYSNPELRAFKTGIGRIDVGFTKIYRGYFDIKSVEKI